MSNVFHCRVITTTERTYDCHHDVMGRKHIRNSRTTFFAFRMWRKNGTTLFWYRVKSRTSLGWPLLCSWCRLRMFQRRRAASQSSPGNRLQARYAPTHHSCSISQIKCKAIYQFGPGSFLALIQCSISSDRFNSLIP